MTIYLSICLSICLSFTAKVVIYLLYFDRIDYANEGKHVITMDVEAAYLDARMIDDKPVYMKIGPLITAILSQLDSNFEKYQHPQGAVIVELDVLNQSCSGTKISKQLLKLTNTKWNHNSSLWVLIFLKVRVELGEDSSD